MIESDDVQGARSDALSGTERYVKRELDRAYDALGRVQQTTGRE